VLKLTIEAAKQVRRQAQESDAGKLALRVAAKRGTDGAIEYGMGFDAERAKDLQFVSEGVAILVSPHSKELLMGTVLDFVEIEPGEFQFIFINPNDDGAPPAADAPE
jgi:iron-sulfur cluster assembly protein